MEFKIEKNIPIAKYESVFPFAKMEVGDSFLVGKQFNRGQISNEMRKFIYRSKSGMKFSTRKAESGIRIWRIK